MKGTNKHKKPKSTSRANIQGTPKSTPKAAHASVSKAKFGQPDKNKRRLSFSPSIKHGPDAPAITKMLSQYAILQNIVRNLATADLVHLAATNKEHLKYITESDTLYEKFKASTICDGKGIRSRTHLFGHFKGDISNVTVKCKEGDCKPCCKCEVMICNVSHTIPGRSVLNS